MDRKCSEQAAEQGEEEATSVVMHDIRDNQKTGSTPTVNNDNGNPEPDHNIPTAIGFTFFPKAIDFDDDRSLPVKAEGELIHPVSHYSEDEIRRSWNNRIHETPRRISREIAIHIMTRY